MRAAIRLRAPDDALVPDGAFGVARLQAAGAARQVVRAAKSATFRRAPPPPYRGKGRRATRGAVARPPPRADRGQPRPATPPDRAAAWHGGDRLRRAAAWGEPVRADADAGGAAVTAIAVHDPRHRAPPPLAAPLALPPRQARACSRAG